MLTRKRSLQKSVVMEPLGSGSCEKAEYPDSGTTEPRYRAERRSWAFGPFFLVLLLLNCGGPKPPLKIAQPTESVIHGEMNSWDSQINALLGGRESRNRARDALIKAGSKAVPALLNHLDDPEFTIRWEMVNILGYIGDPAAAAAVARQATHDPNRHVRWRGYWSLSAMRGDAAHAELKRWFDDSDEAVAWNAAVALALFHDRSVLPRLIAGLDHPDSWRRWEAVNSIKSVGDETAVPALSRVLSGSELNLRREAVLTLAAIPGEAATEALLQALEDSSPQVRWRAVMGLSRRQDDRIRQRLIALRTNDPDPSVQEQIRKALGP